jgi:PhnB protein
MEPTRSPKLAPYLVIRDAPGFIKFLETALGGSLSYQEKDDDGRVHHAEVKVADSVVMISDVPAGSRPYPAMLHLYVEDCDEAYARALKSGATSVRPPSNGPDGDRRGGVADPWGNQWWFSQHPAKS